MRKDGTISASEVSEYSFCNVAWYMDNNGYPRSSFSSKRMEHGKKMHRQLEPQYKRASIAARVSMIAAVIFSLALILFILGLV